ncbi:histidine phosphatase superfamily [Syncephalis fuscata]|nr:histidine phosphatase superfamily [Syncephalis fuscata]
MSSVAPSSRASVSSISTNTTTLSRINVGSNSSETALLYSDSNVHLCMEEDELHPPLPLPLSQKNSRMKLALFRHRGCHLLFALSLIIILLFIQIIVILTDDAPLHPLTSRKLYSPEQLRDLLSTNAPYDPPAAQLNVQGIANNTCMSSEQNSTNIPDRCELVHYQLLSRHGTRYPKALLINEWNLIEKRLKRNIRSDWPEWLKEWQNPYSANIAGKLAKQGIIDMQDLARRDVCRYGPWLGGQTNQSHYDNSSLTNDITERSRLTQYISVDRKQCIESTKAYASVFSEEKLDHSKIRTIPVEKDHFLGYGSSCPAWHQSVNNKYVAHAASDPYISRYLPGILQSLAPQLGNTINNNNFQHAAALCAFEYAIEQRADRWCKLLRPEQNQLETNPLTKSNNISINHKLLHPMDLNNTQPNLLQLTDFIWDIIYYHKASQGNARNTCIVHKLMLQLLNEMQLAVLGRAQTRWQLRFTQDTTILLILAYLNIDATKPVFHPNRAFRTSRLAPFAANIHFELLNCTSDGNTNNTSSYFIRMLHNEQTVQIPGCDDNSILCPWDKFYSIIHTRKSNCSFHKACYSKRYPQS